MNGVIVQSKHVEKFAMFQLAVAILFSGGALRFSLHGNSEIYLEIFFVFLAFATFAYKYSLRIPIFRDKGMRSVFYVILCVLASTLISFSSFTPTVSGRCILSVFHAYILLCCFDNGKEALDAFVRVIRFFAFTGIVCWFLFVICHIPHTWMPSISTGDNSGVMYHTIYMHNIMLDSTRNPGPFWEPSIYAGYLMVSLVVSKFMLGYKLKRILPFIIALLTSQSSGGVMMLSIFVVICIWESNRENKSNSILTKLVIVCAMIVCVVMRGTIQDLLLKINEDMFSKIINATHTFESETRVMSFIVDIRIWLESPIWGVGVSAMEERFLVLRDVISKITNMAHTSTTTEYIAAFGIGGFWINWLWIRGLFDKHKSIVINTGIILIVFLMLNEAPQINFVLTYFALFSLVKYRLSDNGEMMIDKMMIDKMEEL